jgi:uncharacterized protein (TIGR03437 family)
MRFFIPLAMLASTVSGADFTTYIGDQNQYQVSAVAADSAGNTYATGSRFIESAPALSSNDVFVTKLDPNGNIVFTTTFGGKGIDIGNAIAVDPAGNVWVGGSTTSENFPLRDALQTEPGSGIPGGTGFLVELAPDGTVIYSSYFGGLLGSSSVNGVATDQSGAVYLTGVTDSTDFPTTAGLPAGKVNANEITPFSGAFITKLDAAGQDVIYSAVILGGAVDCSGGSSCFLSARNTSGVAIALDPAGDAFIAGNTNTTDLPVTTGVSFGYGAFAAEINAAGNQLVYLTYLGPPAGILALGPSDTINATGIAADASGNAYLTGSTNDPQFPATTGAYQTTLNANPDFEPTPSDAFAIKLSPAGAVVWASYLGGPGNDGANSIGLDGSDDVWLVGNNAAGFPSGRPGVAAAAGDFLVELSADGSKLLYTAEFPAGTAGQGLAIDANGVIHDAGGNGIVSTITPGQPSAARVLGIVNAAAGQLSGRISPGEVISIFGFGLGPATGIIASPSNGLFPTSVGGVQVLVNGSAIPLLYVSASQINAEIPAPLNGMDSAVIQVINGLAMLPDFHVSVAASIFGIFRNADGTLAAINQDGTLNSASNPAKAGSFVSIWATGFDENSVQLPLNGSVATGANFWCTYCSVTLENGPESVQYAGAAPGLIDGIMQINFMVPAPVGQSPAQTYVQFNLGDSGFVWVTQ